jgi:hypothetical protein
VPRVCQGIEAVMTRNDVDSVKIIAIAAYRETTKWRKCLFIPK